MSTEHLIDKKETVTRWFESRTFTARGRTSSSSCRKKQDMLGEQRIKICIVNPKRKEKQGTDPTNIIGYNYNAIVLKAMVMCFVLLKKKKSTNETQRDQRQIYVYMGREGNGNPLQYSCLGNIMDIAARQATVHGVTQELDTT